MTPAERATQRDRALAKANQIRTSNGRTMRELHALSVESRCAALDRLADIIENDHHLGTLGCVPLYRLLNNSVWRFGPGRIRRLLRTAGIYSGDYPVRQLTTRQRSILADELRFLAEKATA